MSTVHNMQGDPVKIITFNVNGVLNPIKRHKILTKLKREKAQFALLQETHMSQAEHLKLKRMGFRHVFSSADGTSHKKGVATLISSAINYEHISEVIDGEGRFVSNTGKMEGTLVTIINVYIPPGSDWPLYRRILDLMVNSQGVVVCGGDFNIKLSNMDSSATTGLNNPISRKVNALMGELGMIDVWRELHPDDREYTHHSCPHAAYSRLDYFFMFTVDGSRVRSCDIETIDLSDHSPVSLSIHLGRKKRASLWRLNSYILNKPKIVEKIKKDIKEFMELNNSEEISPAILWDTLKAVMRGKLISLTAHLKKVKQQKLLMLEDKLKQLQLTDGRGGTNPTLKQEIKKTQAEINDIYSQDTQKNFLFLRQKYYEAGGKSAKYLAYKLRKQQEESTIYKIKNPLTNVIETKSEKIKECFEFFYRDLYSQPVAADEAQIDSFLGRLDLPKLTDSQNEELIKPITNREVDLAISRLKRGKSPGSDGYNTEWYKCLRLELLPILTNTFNWILGGGTPPPSWSEAIISIIPKEGKDRQECDNYRPISVLNLDYKLFTSIMARRLEKILASVASFDQAGFIRGRQTSDNIRRSLHILSQITKDKTKALVVSFDFRKAFDSVRWLFLYKVLAKFGFHDSFIEVVQALYNKPTARIKVNGDLSDRFELKRGSRQGCAISPLLFDLFIEPLGQLIRQSEAVKGIRVGGVEHKVAMFADDVLGTLGEPEVSFDQLMDLLSEFGDLSGYRLNVSKTQVMALNFQAPQAMREKYELLWENDHIKYLGINISKDPSNLSQVNFDPISIKIKSDLHRWNLIPFLSLNSRISAIKMNVLPRLLYLFRNLPIKIEDNQFKEWDKWISRFLWQGKKPRIKFSTLQLRKDKGGLALPNLKKYYDAAQLTPLLYWSNKGYKSRWKELESCMVGGYPLQAVIGDPNLVLKADWFDNPWIGCTLGVWERIINTYKIQNLVRLFRWPAYDIDFIPNRGDIRFQSWIGKGFTNYITCLDKNNILSFQFLQEKCGLERSDFFRYLQVRHYINQECHYNNLSEAESEFYRILKSSQTSIPCKSVSALYNAFLKAENGSTLYVKERWEKDAGMVISEEMWAGIWKFQSTTTCSADWREHCWKNVIRYFRTPHQERYRGQGWPCWRQCGAEGAGHFHIFWECPKLAVFWEGVHRSICSVFNKRIPFDFVTMFFGSVECLSQSSDIKLMQILLAATKKSITRRWLNAIPPRLGDWHGIILEIFKMEKITYQIRTREDKFYTIWNKWITHIAPTTSDFV